MDDVLLEQANEKGKPFLIPTSEGEYIRAFPKSSYPDLVPVLEIKGKQIQIVEKLKWYQYAIGGIPILLLFIGGAIGGGIGAVGAITNFRIFRQEGSAVSKYLKVVGIIIGTYLLYFIVTAFFSVLFSKN
ncbi:hypothetical protein [Adhaeribacter aerolatus]|nr:hypothetical protein [Adhaeribacter aerolatus]